MKLFKTLLVIALLLTSSLNVSADHGHNEARFQDVPLESPYFLPTEYLALQNIFQGQGGSDNFDPNGPLNRAEWAVILLRVDRIEPSPLEYRNCFPDVQTDWFAPAVCYANELEWIKGYQAGENQGKFVPWNRLNLAEVVVILERVYNWPTKPGETWFDAALGYARSKKLVDPLISFDHQVTRAEAADILFRALVIEDLDVDIYEPLLGEVALQRVRVEGGSESFEEAQEAYGPDVPGRFVQLKSFPQETDRRSIPRGALYVPLLRFQVESQQPVVLEGITVGRITAGKAGDIERVRLIVDGKVLRESPFNRAEHAAVWDGLEIPLVPLRPSIVEVDMDFSREAIGRLSYRFQIAPDGLSFKEDNVTVQGSAIAGPNFVTLEADAETITISNPKNKLNPPFIERDDQIIGRFQVKAGKNDVIVKRIRLQDDGDVTSGRFSNFRVIVGDRAIGQLATIDRKVLDFAIDDYLIEAEKERTITVMADIGFARVDDTVRLYLDDAEDFYAFDLRFGFGAAVDNQFGPDQAWCVGAEITTCPAEGLRRKCSRDDRERNVPDCDPIDDDKDDDEPEIPETCDDRSAPVCGTLDDEGLVKETFQNRCLAQKALAKKIDVGPCP